MVRAVRPAVVRLSEPVTAVSNLMVDRDVEITTRVTGVIESLEADRGDFVRKGQPLAILDQSEFRLDQQAAEETFRLREAELARYRELSQQKLASQAEVDQRKAAYELARVELEKAKLLMKRSVIRAPYDGVIADRFVRVGQKVLLNENTPLFKITALEPLITRAYFPEQALGKIHVGQKVLVTAAEFPDATAIGRVSFISPIMEAGSASFQVMVTVARDSGRVFRPGMGVKLTFETDGRLTLPASCLVESNAGRGSVFEISDERLKLRQIEFVPGPNHSIEVRSGISESSWIVDRPSPDLRNGTRVQVNR